MKLHTVRSSILIVLCSFVPLSCATYYQVNQEFNQYFEQGNLESALKVLDHNKKVGRKKSQFLYFANQGVVNAMQGNLEESNDWFEKAYLFGEDYQKNYADIAASFLVNPNQIVYKGEDHEQLLLLYYKALNFLKLKDYESALVECRRLINRLNELSDKYNSDNKYRQDAFVHNLMGIIFEASGDINNAFVAYRNAYNIYKDEYHQLFGMTAPDQLKVDLLRSAYENGYLTDLDFYEKETGMKYQPGAKQELVFFWHNGLGPVKDEWSINFTTVDGGNGMVTFVNEQYGMNFPFAVGDPSRKGELVDLRFFRVAFPKYVERKLYYKKGVILSGKSTFQLDLAEDVNAIAFKTLQERMTQELAKGLLRAAVKKTVEMAVRGEQNDDEKKSKSQKEEEAFREGLSLLIGAINAVTEKADTRNWQTIPHSIYYTRVPMEVGQNEVVLQTNAVTGGKDQVNFTFDAKAGETIFHSYQSLEYMR